LKGKTAKLTRVPRDSTHRITRGVCFRQRCQQGRVLRRSWVQSDLRNELHTVRIIAYTYGRVKERKPLKRGAGES
jgi:hypothetical protein